MTSIHPTSLFFSSSVDQSNSEGLAYLNKEGLFTLDSLDSGNESTAIPPQYADLARLHFLIRSRKVFKIMEFGLGYSTIVMADALRKNHEDWESLPEKPSISGPADFQLHCVDTSEYWIGNTKKKIPDELKKYVTFHFSNVQIGTFQDRVCHYYDTLPDISPDFIYLDGPDPSAVQGSLSGITFSENRIVVAGDLLRIEPILFPGTLILVDGRSANVRFLSSHFYRNWEITSDKNSDVTIFVLDEPALGTKQSTVLEYQHGFKG